MAFRKMITENTVFRADKIVADAAEEAWKFAGDLIVPYGNQQAFLQPIDTDGHA